MATLREVKVEPDTFIPQLRAFPVVVVQPDSSEVACGRKISLDDSYNYSGCKDIETGHAAAPVDSLGGQGIKDSGNLPEEKSGVSSQENKEDTTFNPLTHYLTGLSPLLWHSAHHSHTPIFETKSAVHHSLRYARSTSGEEGKEFQKMLQVLKLPCLQQLVSTTLNIASGTWPFKHHEYHVTFYWAVSTRLCVPHVASPQCSPSHQFRNLQNGSHICS